MNVYLIGFRLYLNWFIIIHIIGLFIFTSTNLYFGVISEILLIPAIYFLAQISAKRYQFFFNNSGFSQTRVFAAIGLAHVAAFSILTGIFTAFSNA